MEVRKVKVIPKRETIPVDLNTGVTRKKRVCAYARVSTDLEDQKNSFNAQKEEYESRIKTNPDWEFVGLYSDEGITGTSIKNRKGFLKMIEDALAGEIDLILTKSISRFARNTVDCLSEVRKLREANVEVFFEKENISTNDTKIEMMLTIFASMAQEESKSISENVKWGIRKRMARGVTHINPTYLLGYEKDEAGQIVVKEDEAETIVHIFNLYISGFSYRKICEILVNEHRTNWNGEVKWTVGMIHRILSNEKYTGDVILQKTFVKDFLTHKRIANEGQVPSYVVENHHEAIISKELFMYVQALRDSKFNEMQEYDRKGVNPLSGLIICGCCGRVLSTITTHPGKAYRKKVFTCRNTSKSKEDYIPCSIGVNIDFNLAIESTIEVIKKFHKIDEEKSNAFVENLIKEVELKSVVFYNKVIELETEIQELEKKLKAIVKQQALKNDYSSSESLFNKTKDELERKRKSLKVLKRRESNEHSAMITYTEIQEFLESNTMLNGRIVRQLISKIIRTKDNHLLYVLGKTNDDMTLKELMEIEPIFTSSVSNEYSVLNYKVIKVGDKND